MKVIITIVKSLEDSGLLMKAVTKTIENETKEQNVACLSTLLDPLGANLLSDFEKAMYYQNEPQFKGVVISIIAITK